MILGEEILLMTTSSPFDCTTLNADKLLSNSIMLQFLYV